MRLCRIPAAQWYEADAAQLRPARHNNAWHFREFKWIKAKH